MVREIDDSSLQWPCPTRCRTYRERCGDKDDTCPYNLDGYVIDDPNEPIFVADSGLEQPMLEAANLLAVCAPAIWRPQAAARSPRWRSAQRPAGGRTPPAPSSCV